MTDISQESKELQLQDWYLHLVDECKAIITEAVFTSRWALVEGYWNLGKRIREEVNLKRKDIYAKNILTDLSKSIHVGERDVYRSIQVYDKYPDINALPEGKNITWNKLITKYLPDPRKEINIDGIVLPEEVQVINKDFRESEIADNSVDCIITDPPYPSEFLPLWDDLGKFANRVLKPSSFLIAYSGELNLPSVIEALNKHLSYYWTFCLYHEGQTQLVLPRNVICRWKPVLIYQKPPFKKLETVIQDYVVSKQPEKQDHEWQQSESGVKELIEKFTRAGDLVIDPFAGSGTFSKVAHEMKRNSIAFEVDKLAYKSAVKKIYDNTKV